MKLITRNTDYAIRVLCKLAERRRFVSTTAISKETKVPLAFLRSILGRMIKEKIVVSKEGKNGGIRLEKSPSSINLTDIMRLFQGKVQISQCLLRKKVCPERKKCPLRKRLKEIESFIEKEFKKITVQTLTKKRSENERENVLQAM
ncbi:MAG: Rrf2 family transcriptional regulator [Candidatus Omnitrophica bacterium]|nr:Rrf2 family transcriptional regulator [Candidatus Omnitrophota bacterium]MCM8828222.1 Rrf2 family transcriptional regulator [Candidatus Omnitrophota bacterium]